MSSDSGVDAGPLVVLATTPPSVSLTGAIAVDATSVYWSTADGNGTQKGTVMKVHTTGGAATTLYSGLQNPGVLALAGTNVYWCDSRQSLDVVSVPVIGGAATTLYSGAQVNDLAVGPASAYFWTPAQTDGAAAVQLTGASLVDGGAPSTLTTSAFPGPLAVSGANIYWADQQGDVVTVALAGGTPNTLVTGSPTIFVEGNIAVDGSSVYWMQNDLDTGTDALLSAPLVGGAATTLASGSGFAGLAVDATSVYFTTNSMADTGAVMSVPLGGGTPATLFAGEPGVSGVAVDATSVYWTNTASGNVTRLTPK